MNDIPAIRIKSIHGFGESESGRWLVVEVSDHRGQRATIRIPHNLEVEFLSKFQGASGTAAEARGEELNEKIRNVMNPESIDMGVTGKGKIGLRMNMSNGSTLDLVLPDDATKQLQQALTELEDYKKAGGPTRVN